MFILNKIYVSPTLSFGCVYRRIKKTKVNAKMLKSNTRKFLFLKKLWRKSIEINLLYSNVEKNAFIIYLKNFLTAKQLIVYVTPSQPFVGNTFCWYINGWLCNKIGWTCIYTLSRQIHVRKYVKSKISKHLKYAQRLSSTEGLFLYCFFYNLWK